MTANPDRFSRAPRAALFALASAMLLFEPACRSGTHETWAACARIQSDEIDECSGIAASRRFPGVYWVHNDSGDRARFFGIDRQGALLAEIEVDGANNVDWEDIAVDDAGNVYLGDFGNNRNQRRDLTIYVVDEPDPRSGDRRRHVSVRRRLPFRYPDQKAFPDSTAFNFDCEAMFWAEGRIGLLTKHRSDLRTTLYWIDPSREAEQVAERIADHEIGSPVTAADCSPDGRILVVLSYHYIHLFERSEPGGDFFTSRSSRTIVEGRQCEGICIDGDRVIYTNEQREIYCLSSRYLRTHDRFLPEPPTVGVPQVEPALDGRPDEWRGASGRLEFGRHVQVPRRDGRVLDRAADRTALGDSVDVRAGWCSTGVVVYADWPLRLGRDACPPSEDAGGPVGYLMLGTPGSGRPCLEAGQEIWAVVPEGDSLALRPGSTEEGQPRCGAAATSKPRVASRKSPPERRVLEALLPVPGGPRLEVGQSLLLGVVLVEAGCREPVEFGWAATLDMQPLGNPLLWGRARLERGPAAGR